MLRLHYGPEDAGCTPVQTGDAPLGAAPAGDGHDGRGQIDCGAALFALVAPISIVSPRSRRAVSEWHARGEGQHVRVMVIRDEVRPDVVVTDNVTGYPAVQLAAPPADRVSLSTHD